LVIFKNDNTIEKFVNDDEELKLEDSFLS